MNPGGSREQSSKLPNIFFLPNGCDIWLEVARYLNNREYSVALFLGDDRLINQFSLIFPECQILRSNQFKNGDFSRTKSPSMPSKLRRSVEFREFEKYAMYSLQRQETSGNIGFLDRQSYVTSLADFLYASIIEAEVTHVIYGETPHTASGLLTGGIAAAMGVPILHFQQCSIAPLAQPLLGLNFETLKNSGRSSAKRDLADCLGVPPGSAPNASKIDLPRRPPDEVVRCVERFFARVEASEEVENEVTRLSRERRYQGPFGLGRRFLQSFFDRESLRRTQESLSNSEIGRLIPDLEKSISFRNIYTASGLAWRNSKRMSLIRRSTKTSPLAGDGKHVTLFLQFEPELTCLPTSGVHADQLAVARALAFSLPDGWHLEIREHPSQATFGARGYRGRSRLFYEEMIALPRTHFQPHSIRTFDAIRRSSAVATLGGTVALEAMILGVPALCFGRPWFKGLPGCHLVEDVADTRDILAKVAMAPESHLLEEEEVLDFLSKRFFRLVPNPSGETYWRRLGVEPFQDLGTLQQCLDGFLQLGGLYPLNERGETGEL